MAGYPLVKYGSYTQGSVTGFGPFDISYENKVAQIGGFHPSYFYSIGRFDTTNMFSSITESRS